MQTVDGKQFRTTQAAAVVDTTAIVTATAVSTGSAANVAANTIVQMPAPLEGVTAVSNPSKSAGGTATETDDDFRNRILDRVRNPGSSGNINHYIQWAMEVDGVGAVKVFPLWSGGGTVKVAILDSNRLPAAQAIVDAVKLHIEAERPVGADVTVESGEIFAVEVIVDVERYIQIVHFDKHQNPHPREAPSNIPAAGPCPGLAPAGSCLGSALDLPSRAESPSLTTDSPSQGLSTTTTEAVTLVEPITTPNNNPLQEKDEFVVVVDLLAKNICLVSNQVETDLIRDCLATMPPGWVMEAVQQAALGKARSLRYVDTILRAWAAKYRPHEMPWLIERQERQQRPARDRPRTFMEKAEAMLCQH